MGEYIFRQLGESWLGVSLLAFLAPVLVGWLIWYRHDSSRFIGSGWFPWLFFLSIATALTAKEGNLDYPNYAFHWKLILAGQDPWIFPGGESTGNAYGPLYNYLALLYACHPLLPKCFFVSVWFCLILLFEKDLFSADRAGLTLDQAKGFVVFLLLNPFFWLRISWQGMNDICTAACCVLAVRAADRERDGVAGAWLGAGTLFKFMPALLFPFLVIGSKGIRRKIAASFLLTVTAGFAMSCLVWGRSTWQPLLFAAQRQSSWYSIFRFLRGRYSPLQAFFDAPDLDPLSGPLLALSLIVVFLIHWKRAWRTPFSSFVAFETILLTYKVHHPQFHLISFLLGAYWLAGQLPEAVKSPRLVCVIIVYTLWFSLGVNFAQAGFGRAVFEEIAGLPCFIIQFALWYEMLRFGLARGRVLDVLNPSLDRQTKFVSIHA
jgi:Glycosyltransferase family 87